MNPRELRIQMPKQVTIIQDDKVVRGTKNNTSALATVKLEKNGSDKMNCTLESIKGYSIPGLDPCTISSDGTASFYGISYKDAAVKGAFREAMSYLKKTDEPITMQIFQGE